MIDLKEVTVENFSYSNVKRWVSDWSHKEKVQFAVNCAELVIDLYAGSSDAPKKAIQAAKDWLSNPSDKNKRKCRDAAADAADAADAYAADAADAYAADAAADAAYAADAADDADAAAAYAADAADAADAAAVKKPIKEKIIDLIVSKNGKESMEKWNGEGWPPAGTWCWIEGGCGEHPLQHFGRIDFISSDHVVYTREERGEYCQRMKGITFRAQETPERRIERERLEAAYELFCCFKHACDTHHAAVTFERFKSGVYSFPNGWLAIVDKTGYRKAVS